MTEQEFLDLEQTYLKEVKKRDIIKKIQEMIPKIQARRLDNPSITFAKETLPLSPEQKTLVCDFIVNLLEEELKKNKS
jgi:hypothetical protein